MTHIRHLFLKFIIIAFVGSAVLSSCHSSKETAKWEDSIYAKNDKKDKNKDNKKDNAQKHKNGLSKTRQKVIEIARDWIGVRYKYGGNTRNGVDCSGFMCIAFDKGAGIQLPRSSSEQARYCKNISRNNIKPGDLVFFVSVPGGNRINHVALYIGDNRVIHSTTSLGVMISDLNDEYWRTHYHSCGMIIMD